MSKKIELNDIDKNYIRKNRTKPLDQLRIALSKPVRLIKDYLDELTREGAGGIPEKSGVPATQEIPSLLSPLRLKPEWRYISQQFSADELELYEVSYNDLISSFGDDVQPTEEKQVFQAIELDIFMHRNKIRQRRAIDEIEHHTAELEYQRELGKHDRDEDKVRHSEQVVATLTQALPGMNKEYNDLSKKHADIIKDLKGTRDQRFKVLESSKYDFLGLIKNLAQEEMRRNTVIEAEVLKEARKREQERIRALHTFKDGTVDPPILDKGTAALSKPLDTNEIIIDVQDIS